MAQVSSIAAAWKHRAVERRTFAAAFSTVAAAYTALILVKLANAPSLDPVDLAPLAVFLMSLIVLHLSLVVFRSGSDRILLAPALLLSGLGIATQLRLHSYNLSSPADPSNYAFPLGVLALTLTAGILQRGRTRLLQRLAWPGFLAAIAVLAAVLLLGRRFRGAVFLPGNVNPTEIVKVFLVVFLAHFLTVNRRPWEQTRMGLPAPRTPELLTFAVLWSLPMGLLVLQRDLGMLILMNAVLVAMLFLATNRRGYLVAGLALVIALVFVMYRFVPHTRNRILAWIDPFADPTGRGWQSLQALSAMYCGGLWGVGLGTGSPQAIPIASSDFVYAVLAEELGLVGCGLVLAAFLLLVHRCFRAALSCRDDFSRLLTGGLSALMAFQILLNVGGVTKSIPLTGMTLPFISHGGSSMVTSFFVIGIVLAASDAPPPRQRKARAGG